MKDEAYINGEVGDGAKPSDPVFQLFHLFQFVSCVPAVSPVSRNIASRSETKQIMYTNFKQRLDGVIGEVKAAGLYKNEHVIDGLRDRVKVL